jgi:hypothetical protein
LLTTSTQEKKPVWKLAAGETLRQAPHKLKGVFYSLGLRLFGAHARKNKILAAHLDLPVTIPRGSHPFPSRTRKLSLAGPMVLHA